MEPARELERWQSEGDSRLWKRLCRRRWENRLTWTGSPAISWGASRRTSEQSWWVAVTHFSTEHPHVHIALRGIRDDKSALDLPRDCVRHGIRAIAEDLCTRQPGHRNHLDAEQHIDARLLVLQQMGLAEPFGAHEE